MLIDMHSHSTLSDGTLTVEEMVAAADRRGYKAYAITDHARGDDRHYGDVAAAVRETIDRLQRETPVALFAGAELTDFEPAQIPEAAREVRRRGAQVVVVHGECVSMDVLPGTNAAAVRTPEVDILAHPGLLTLGDALEAAKTGTYLEISARQGHNWANGHVYRTARKARACIIVDSDGHEEGGLLSIPKVEALLRGAGASERVVYQIWNEFAPQFVARLQHRMPAIF